MKKFDSILQNYYMGKLPKYQQRPGTVDEDAIRAYMMGLSGRAPKQVPKSVSKGLTQIPAQDQFYQNQLQKYGRTREDIERSRQEAALPFLLATGAIGAATAAPLLATVAPAIGAGLSYAPIASAPAATLGNLLSSGFASDFLLNRAPQIPSQIGRGQYGDALANTAFGALDLMGVGAINPNIINNAGRLVNQGRQYLGNTYRNIAEGDNIFNYAWRSPARGIDELQARNMYRQIKNQNTLDNATKDLIGEYQYSSGSFTGRFEPAINYARRIQLEDAIDAQRIAQKQNKPTVLVRTFKPTEKELYPINESGRVIMDRPTSWSVGLGAPHSVGDRMVIKLPSGSKGLLNEYNTTKYSQDLAPLSQERELILGSGLNIGKRLGKVKNEFGGYDYIHKFRGYDPTVYDDIRRLNTENIGEIVNLNRNLATSGGFNVGVYPFLKNPNIVLKLGTTGESGMANPNDNIFFTGIPKIARDMPTSMWAINKFPAKEIDLSGLTAQQIGRNTSKPIPNNILGSIMERTNAGSLSNISFDELANIEPWVYRAAARNVNELIRKGIGIDFYGNNILFKSQNNIPEFNFIDLGPLPKNNAGVFPVGPLYALDSKALDQGVRMLDLEALKSIFKQKTKNALYDAAARSGIGSYSDQQIFDAIKKSEASIDEGLSLKKLLSLNNKKKGGPIVNSRGFMNGAPPAGSNWRIPGNTLYNPTPYKIRAVGSNGVEKTLKPFDTKRVNFGDAEYVDEYMLQKGGTAKKSRTHYIFAESPNYKPGSDLREAAKDNLFIKEALDMQSYLNKNYPDEKVVIVPGYEWSNNPYREKIKETLKGSTPEDYIYLYGHHGSRYAGIPVKEWGDYFRNAKYANCFLGSCYSDDLVTQQYPRKENSLLSDFDETQAPDFNTAFGRLRNFYYRPAEAWWGVNPNAPKGKDLLEGVTSAMYSTTNVKRNPSLEKYVAELQSKLNVASKEVVDKFTSDADYKKLMEKRNQLWGEATNTSDLKIKKKLNDEGHALDKKMTDIIKKYERETGVTQLTEDIIMGKSQIIKSPYILDKLVPNQHYRKHDYNMLFDFERISPLIQRLPMLLGQTESFKYGGSLSKYQIGGLPLPGGIGIGLMPKTKLVKEDVIVTTTTTRPSNTIHINDPRKVRLTTGVAIDPNRELMSGDYNKNIIIDIIKKSKKRNIDPYIGLAIGMQESGFGKTDSNIGHAVEGSRKVDPVNNYLDIYLQKQKDADRLGITDPYARIQLYNGYGKIFPSTEQKYHGFKMKKIYGVPVPAGGLDLRKNPLYGKQIMDIVDNILKKNPEVVKLVENIKRNGGNALGMLRDYGGGISVPPLYKSGGQHGGLDRWFAEKWVDVKSGKPCGRQEGENRAYPACRPSKRVSSKTPKTSSELSSAEREKFKRSKTSSERISYSHKRRK